MRMHATSGAYSATLGNKRCYSCNGRIVVKVPEKVQDFYYKGKMYCRICILQATHGIELKQTFLKGPLKTCSIADCKTLIKPDYSICYNHYKIKNPKYVQTANKVRSEIAEIKLALKKKPKPKPTPFTVINTKSKGNLRYEFAYCQNRDCANGRVPYKKKDMVKLNNHGLFMYFCSLPCKFLIKEENMPPIKSVV